ncbi:MULTISPECIES: hypothetical protein [unclassified Pantoea]|uniref:hypothetical protein n=1 Tax=unclassified Pantoea TaxID=2630326 RepID=UPI001CD25AB1|nr:MULTISPECIES: hypothetical protein [unclassified Pantoea]MCA1177907.1 hypothetical protein [Pantoea sp. alder69]MCA1252005.1 hypothetical protein [Pantoea sp. alder70]MCA1266329.1 hypothetical protein [Pantoea sp. alder81]
MKTQPFLKFRHLNVGNIQSKSEKVTLLEGKTSHLALNELNIYTALSGESPTINQAHLLTLATDKGAPGVRPCIHH